MNAEQPAELVIAHAALGELRWTKQSGEWVGRVSSLSGEWSVVIVDEHGSAETLNTSVMLYQRAIRAERKILRTALRAEVSDLYNESWAGGSGELGEGELLSRLRLELVNVDVSGYSAIEFHYDGTELFGGHVLVIELDEKLKYQDCDLRG
ncbi:hypothetical protein GobsT_16180 [Gemmata obscuriglobus]|uniref:DUF2262 domain-containing protein n=1 Tax=Gemmata obscuriglobus TaxID=114 RepID=A0A2Z3H1S6_9BACT|nr:hypothetical protein [Gemmata obscuriglobus]AWM39983.1 hypothetical protein C1280_25235 [Gemmata obscuriglobus]QEG26870.1 hypothetical protein GobsT_16180 [Gemmata obscuriglobus]VTS02901.1 : DUF2262 [Gemmata obscuriglobus UQM 2246]